MRNLAVVGAQWGDEGKGKVVDFLAPRFSIVARYQGGPNAGHTVVIGENRYALHHIPSGIFHDGVLCLIGAGTLVDPERILEEMDRLRAGGISVEGRLLISSRAHVILPFHRTLDGALEHRLGVQAIGTTRRGIGPAYAWKAERWGLRLADLACPEEVGRRIQQALDSGVADWLRLLEAEVPDPQAQARQAAAWWEKLGPLCGGVSQALQEALAAGRPVLFEGAQGTLLDIDHGTYPFVTSSSTIAGGIPASLGIPPRAVERVLGVTKAYTTRVGSGPFPTEDHGAVGEALRGAGREFGTTTGRPRRCGWLDLVALRHAVQVNGLDGLALTKFDVLTGLDPVRIAVAYEIEGRRVDTFPALTRQLDRAVPIFEDLPGWKEDLSRARSFDGLPPVARAFVRRVAELAGCPVAMVSVGPDRFQTILTESGLDELVPPHPAEEDL